jgi:polyphosphate kinase
MVKNKFFNRELSWLEFNGRVLEEALDDYNPLLERLKFLSIFAGNLDEFFMVRISALISQSQSGKTVKDPSGLKPDEILSMLHKRIEELVAESYKCFSEISDKLEKEDFHFYNAKNVPDKYKEELKKIFMNKYFMILTPMAIDQAHPFPFLESKSLNLLLKIENPKNNKEPLFAVIPIPMEKSFIEIPDDNSGKKFIYTGELIKLFSSSFFKGYNVLESAVFRITRDAELSIDEEGAEDLLQEIEGQLRKREKGAPVRLEVESSIDEELFNFLKENVKFYNGFCFKLDGALDLSLFSKIAFMNGNENLKDEKLIPVMPDDFSDEKENIFDVIDRKDRFVCHPYESFDPVVRFIEDASCDPKVLAIKQTLYRTGDDSPIIKALKKAALNGKQVTVLVELKARFDEAQNINWAKQLEEAGCHVVYGLVGLKTHCKLALVVRDEESGIKRYIHLSTGNYNGNTAKIYTDIGLFTNKNTFGRDVSAIFNVLTGYSEPPRWKKLVTAPEDLRNFILEKITGEIENVRNGGKGKIIAKMNALVDTKTIEALYHASSVGVEIQLIVRGMCCLVPGVNGLSEKISVISIVDRFLEHSRIFYFYNAGNEDVFISSADWMERNFDRRVETLFPIEETDIKKELILMLKVILSDNVKARFLKSDGKYEKLKIKKDEKPEQSQIELYEYFKSKNAKEKTVQKFIPRMNPENQ